MTWLRIDDTFSEHPKIDGLSDGAFRLHVSALCYAARHLTDGRIPLRQVHRLTPTYEAWHVEELVAVGLWRDDETGFVVHDFLDYNPSRAEVEARKRVRAEAGRKGGLASVRSRRADPPRPPAEANASAHGRAPAGASVKHKNEPRPVPSRPSSSSSKPPPPRDPVAALPVEEEDDEDRIEATLRDVAIELSERVLARRGPGAPPILNRTGWLRKTTEDRIAQHRDRIVDLLAHRPGLTIPELADELEPDLRPPVPPPEIDLDCPACRGSSWVDVEGGVNPCPRCRP